MRKSTAIIAAVLALLTGIVLGQLESLATPGFHTAPATPTTSTRTLATVRSFYDHLNAFLATGDRAVETILAPDFVDHTGSAATPRNAEELMSGLAATRAALPHLQLQVVDLHDLGTAVAVQLDVDAGVPAGIPGFPTGALQSGQAVEFLRIQHATVAERWSNDDRLPETLFELHADFEQDGPTLSGPAIERVSLAAGQSVELSGRDTVVLRVATGELQIEQAGVDAQGESRPSFEPLEAGQLRVFDVKDKLQLRNRASEPVGFWAFSLYGLYPPVSPRPGGAPAAATPGVETAAIAYMPLQLPASLPDRLRISVTQAVLPTGSWVAPHTPGVVEQIVVLDGSLEASLQSGRALISTDASQMQPFEGTETASAGQGISASSIATVSYRVSSMQPANLLIMIIGPDPGSLPTGK